MNGGRQTGETRPHDRRIQAHIQVHGQVISGTQTTEFRHTHTRIQEYIHKNSDAKMGETRQHDSRIQAHRQLNSGTHT